MGCYVNPTNGVTKDAWLKEHGTKISPENCDWYNIRAEGKLPVVLMDNGPFKAAGIAFSPDELKAFTLPNDYRPKEFFSVDIETLREIAEDLDLYFKG